LDGSQVFFCFCGRDVHGKLLDYCRELYDIEYSISIGNYCQSPGDQKPAQIGRLRDAVFFAPCEQGMLDMGIILG
jgi:hypothetical protein